MRVLVTGHEGYIGTVLTPLLAAEGHDVTGLDSCLFTRGTLGPLPAEIPSILADIRDVTVDQLKGFDAIIHLAGISNDPLGDLNPQCTYDINHAASVRLAERAKAAGVPRFLYASSCSLYGAARALETLAEDAPFNPVTPYGESKLMVEADLMRLADDTFCPTYLRCATVYGYSPRLRADLVVNNLVGYAVTRGEVLLKSDGMSWRPLVHVEDVALAYLAILHAPWEVVHNQPFNVGRSDENHLVRDVARTIQQIVPNCEVRFADGASPDIRCYKVDCRKMEQNLPEYQPRWTVALGVQQLYEAYQQHGLTYEQFTGPEFLRIRQIQSLQHSGQLDEHLRWAMNRQCTS